MCFLRIWEEFVKHNKFIWIVSTNVASQPVFWDFETFDFIFFYKMSTNAQIDAEKVFSFCGLQQGFARWSVQILDAWRSPAGSASLRARKITTIHFSARNYAFTTFSTKATHLPRLLSSFSSSLKILDKYVWWILARTRDSDPGIFLLKTKTVSIYFESSLWIG